MIASQAKEAAAAVVNGPESRVSVHEAHLTHVMACLDAVSGLLALPAEVDPGAGRIVVDPRTLDGVARILHDCRDRLEAALLGAAFA